LSASEKAKFGAGKFCLLLKERTKNQKLLRGGNWFEKSIF